MSNYIGVHHVSFLVRDTQRALRFYCDILGFEKIDRADLAFPGAWLAVGAQQIHLLELPREKLVTDCEGYGGRDRHCAFIVCKLSDLVESLRCAKIAYKLSESGRNALFCRDHDGNALEFIELM